MDFTIQRLSPADAQGIVACFQRVYGDTYAEGLFYDAQQLRNKLANGSLCSVGAVTATGQVIGHMAMTIRTPLQTPELGNTVVDPDMRGAGLAWQIGAELTRWCAQLGYPGFIHYPTAAHHIMQRQSVKNGFEVGLMLGYIPAGTDGKTDAHNKLTRKAATIVYEPLPTAAAHRATQKNGYLPAYGADFIQRACAETGLQRTWQSQTAPPSATPGQTDTTVYARRSLARLTAATIGADIGNRIAAMEATPCACYQLDLPMDSAALNAAVQSAVQAGYLFCGWLPGHQNADVLRLQKVDPQQTDFAPVLENAFAQDLLTWLRG
ncbi:MAG: GNAT family N-acetyltransferase [bacterium]